MTYFAAPGIRNLHISRTINYDKVIRLSAKYFKLLPQQVISECRRRDIVEARFFIMNFLRTEKQATLQAIADNLSGKGKHHSSVIHGLRTLQDWCSTDQKMKDRLNKYIDYMNNNL